MPKVSVVTTSFRPGYIDTMLAALAQQTLGQDDWEFILVDDLYEPRHAAVAAYARGSIKNFLHIPPRELRPYSSNCMAFNTGIAHARGELIYFMNDYLYPGRDCLARHWEIYQKYGPRMILHGPLIDGIVAAGKSVWHGAPAEVLRLREGDKLNISLTWTPAIDIPLQDDFEHLTPQNCISVLRDTLYLPQFMTMLPDWRTGATARGEPVEPNIYRNTALHGWSWWWAGRNASAPTELLLEVNGFDESFDGLHGGADGDIGYRMMHEPTVEMWKEGANEAPVNDVRYLVDTLAPAYELAHPTRKVGIMSEAERQSKVAANQAQRTRVNDYDLRELREKTLEKLYA